MTNLEFFHIINKYGLIYLIAIFFVIGWLYEAIEIKWSRRKEVEKKKKK